MPGVWLAHNERGNILRLEGLYATQDSIVLAEAEDDRGDSKQDYELKRH